MKARPGPLSGLKVLEFPAIGPVPFAGMLLADLGADVLRIDRAGAEAMANDVNGRGKRSIVLNLKDAVDADLVQSLIAKADVLIEGFRPGVMERLGFGPDGALARNSRLIYGRMTGWGQEGPLANAAGHDINYIALTGALAMMAPDAPTPQPPLNLVGDYGGGAMSLVVGVLAALFERSSSGRGQVIDAAMVDGASLLMSIFSTLKANAPESVSRGRALLNGSPHFYRTYECADGKFIAVGALEPHFYKILIDKLGEAATGTDLSSQHPKQWRAGAEALAAIFRRRTRDQWCKLLEGTDACFAPVLELSEAQDHPHLRARQTYVEAFGVVQPNASPRLSRTPGQIQGAPPEPGQGGEEALSDWGVTSAAHR